MKGEDQSGDGKDAFHRVPFIRGEVRDAVERVLTGFRVAEGQRTQRFSAAGAITHWVSDLNLALMSEM